jgi:hypothetical protein
MTLEQDNARLRSALGHAKRYIKRHGPTGADKQSLLDKLTAAIGPHTPTLKTDMPYGKPCWQDDMDKLKAIAPHLFR